MKNWKSVASKTLCINFGTFSKVIEVVCLACYTLAPLHVHFPLKIIIDVSMICIATKETKKLTKSMQNINEVVILAFFLQEEMSNGLHISCSTLYTLNTNVNTIVNNDQQTSPLALSSWNKTNFNKHLLLLFL
jgi:hypothetical protein